MFEHDEVVLEAKHVTRRFPASDGRTLVANDDINLKFYKGKTLGLVGESGCGKSTFMRFLVSLDTPSEGEILYRGIFMFEIFISLREGMLRIRGMSRKRRSYLQLPTVHACSEPERHSR